MGGKTPWPSMVTARGLVVMAAVAAAVGLALASGSVSAASARVAGSAGSATFTDPTSDARGPAPDITTASVSDNPANGTITFALTAVGYASASPDSQPLLKVYLNTDKNDATGAVDQLGAEYYVEASRDASGSYWDFMRWDGSRYIEVSQSPSMAFTRSGDVLTWTFNKSDIGGSTGFKFFAWSSTWDAGNSQTGEDVAPDDGSWMYDLTTATSPTTTPAPPAAPGKPWIGGPATTPAKAVAGKRFTVSFPVTRTDNGKPLTTGTMICDPSVQGKVIPHAESFKNGTAQLSFTIPKSANGKLLKVKVTIKVGSLSTTKVATFHIN